MREKLTVIKVGGKIVEEEATLLQLLMTLPPSADIKCWFTAAVARQQRLPHNWVLKAKW